MENNARRMWNIVFLYSYLIVLYIARWEQGIANGMWLTEICHETVPSLSCLIRFSRYVNCEAHTYKNIMSVWFLSDRLSMYICCHKTILRMYDAWCKITRSTVVYLIILPELWPPVEFVWTTVYVQFWYKYIQ